MKFAEATKVGPCATRRVQSLRLPLGLLGFESIKEYQLVTEPADAPFQWLQVETNPNLAFLIVSPAAVLPSYQPDIPDEDVAFLGLKTAEDAAVYNIVTLRGPQGATLNLKGPIVINRHTLLAKQIIPNNATDYSVRHPLPVSES